jgi:hypothetical protein
MPAAFVACVKGGGRVRTVHPRAGTNMPVCFAKRSGKSTAGEVRKAARKTKTKRK